MNAIAVTMEFSFNLVPKYFCYNCGPIWSAEIQYLGRGVGIRKEDYGYRIILLFWHFHIRVK